MSKKIFLLSSSIHITMIPVEIFEKNKVFYRFFFILSFFKKRNQNKKKPQKNNRNQYFQRLIIINLFDFDVLLIQGHLDDCGSIPTNATI